MHVFPTSLGSPLAHQWSQRSTRQRFDPVNMSSSTTHWPHLASPPGRRVRPCGLVDVSESTQRGHEFEAVTVTEHARHSDGAGELLEVLGRRVVDRHLVDDDAGVSRCRQAIDE